MNQKLGMSAPEPTCGCSSSLIERVCKVLDTVGDTLTAIEIMQTRIGVGEPKSPTPINAPDLVAKPCLLEAVSMLEARTAELNVQVCRVRDVF
jgi:hypothetical protein